MRGQLVYEPDVSAVDFPFPRRLAGGGLHSVVAAPLLFESQVFGILIASRRQVNGFSSGDCEFLRQLSEHVALAAHQAQVYTALEQAYEDLRQTQQTVMRQERLRALGQMASGIAHDINNAVSPVALYTESLLETEPNLSPRTREYLETTQRAIDDVAHTVARMREFYRQPRAAARTRIGGFKPPGAAGYGSDAGPLERYAAAAGNDDPAADGSYRPVFPPLRESRARFGRL